MLHHEKSGSRKGSQAVTQTVLHRLLANLEFEPYRKKEFLIIGPVLYIQQVGGNMTNSTESCKLAYQFTEM